ESIKDYGTQGGTVARNSVAYETGNDDIGNGQPDNGGNITDKDILAGLDGGTTAKKFIYAEQTKTIDILTAASTGLSKMVRATADAQYSYKTITHQSEIYTYRLRMANDNQTSAKDLMFFDSLENYDIGEWKGTLVSVDVAQLREKGVNAKVYYSTIDNLNIENLSVNADYDFVNAKTKSGISIWKTADQIGDLSQVKAIAIDARTATNGSPFTLKANESLSVQVYMKTPATVESEADHPYTFNGIYLYETSISSNGDISDLVEHGYTQVEYRTVGALQIKKVDSTDPSIPVKGVAFTLTGKSHYGTEYDMTVVTNADGIAQFDGLERGEYLIQETEAVDDYLANHVALRVVVDKNGVVTVAGLEQAADGSYIFPNDPRAHGDLVFYKVSTESNAKRIGGVTFKLSGTSSYGNNVLIYATSDSLGKVVLENGELGPYDLTEVEPPEGYITPHHTWKVTCDQNGLLTLAGEDSELVDYTQYVVKNEPYHSFTHRKADIETNEALAGAVFTLKGVSDYETVVDLEVTSGEDGHADFTDLEPGTYILQETVAPENHVLDETQRVVTITRDGTITIEGLEQDETYGFFNYVNEQEFNGTITITKKWVGDEDDPDNRTFPQLVLTTDVELAGYLEATIDATKWQKFKDDNDFITCTSFQPAAKTLTKDEVLDKGAVRIDDGSESSDCPIYAWVEGTDIYWWSEATDAVFLPTHSKNFFASPVWNTSNSLKTVDLRGLSWSKVRDASYMFANCSNLSKLDWNASDIEKGHNLRDMSWMFYKCQTLTSLDMSHFDTSKVTTMGDMFAYCSGLASLDVSHFDTSNVTSMDSMFMHCSSLTSLDVSSFNTSNVESMSSMFAYCSSLIELDLTNFDGKKKCSIKNMFKGCSNLERLDLSGAVMIAGYDSSSAFYGCRNLKVLDLSGFDMRNTLYTNYMFDGCINLETIYVSYSWNREGYGAYWSTGTSWAMFSSCRNLKGGAGSTVNTTSEYAYMSARIDGDGGKGIFTKKEAPTT
ncbi:MAG: BspA family leucine-rich repeat surface protein, partial [Oscillospiraceae bacterium]|nr:BspA family leucine-rich repeat surface protein [Oscillospiraceae bacterium]